MGGLPCSDRVAVHSAISRARIPGVNADWTAMQPVTSRQLLAMPFLADAELLGGHEGLDRLVRDSAAAAGNFASMDLPSSAALVLDGSGLRNDTYQIDIALRRLAEVEGAALVVVASASPIGVATGRLANKLRIPLLSLPAGDALAVCDRIREVVLAPGAGVSRLIMGSLDALRRASDSTGVVGALQALTELMDAPASLVGLEGGVVAGDLLDPPLAERDRLPVPITGRLGTVTQVIHPISLAPRENPSFWIVMRRDNATDVWTATAGDVLQVAAWAVGTRLVADRLQRERDARFRLGVLNAITASGDHPEPALLEQIGVLGWHVGGWCTAIHVQVAGDVDQVRVLALTDDLSRALESVGIRSQLIERPDGWSLWTSSPSEPPTTSYRDVVSGLRRAVQRFTQAHSHAMLLVGVGRPYASLPGLQKSLAEAREASIIAMAGAQDSAVQHIDELGVKRILLGWYASESFAEFAGTLLGPLMAEDPQGELLATLEAFLDNESAPTVTANQLHIHRNTVINRMDRIRGLLSVDLDDPDERLAVQLACRVVRLRRFGALGAAPN